MARALMVQGTASSVGKSLLVTGLCRYFSNKGLRVAPFKALNMALNAHVTEDGFEMARAQAVQAEAARIAPAVEMNPILLKPEGNASSQVVVLGRARGARRARDLFHAGLDLREVALDAFSTLGARADLVLIEGAGSPAEINLRDRDVANMFMARHAAAPVLLVGDIDRGGVLAAFVGTLELLEPEDRARVAALWINKFRGDLGLLEPGLAWLEQRTEKPVLGVLPHLGRLGIAEEDSLNVDARSAQGRSDKPLQIAVLRLPRISNHDEFQPFELEPDVALRFVEDPREALAADLLLLPGSKSTIADLAWLRAQGLDHVVKLRALRGEPVMGICGGCQMLGERILDPDRVESSRPEALGLGLLPIRTAFQPDKRTLRVAAARRTQSWLFSELSPEVAIPGYYIHAGITRSHSEPAFAVACAGETLPDGATSENGAVVGTMLHGLFEHDGLRHALLKRLRQRRGLPRAGQTTWDPQADYERLAAAIAEHCDTALLDRLGGIAP